MKPGISQELKDVLAPAIILSIMMTTMVAFVLFEGFIGYKEWKYRHGESWPEQALLKGNGEGFPAINGQFLEVGKSDEPQDQEITSRAIMKMKDKKGLAHTVRVYVKKEVALECVMFSGETGRCSYGDMVMEWEPSPDVHSALNPGGSTDDQLEIVSIQNGKEKKQ